MAEAILMIFNLIFFWKAYNKPFSLARSELLSTFFPSWIWQGREWSKWRIPKYDPYYWLNAHAHPVLSTYYPLHILSSVLGAVTGLDTAFKIFLYQILMHHIWASLGWFLVISSWASWPIALFGALTLTYSAYNIKQQPCIVYTIAWFPWMILGITKGWIWLASLGFGMTLLGGYYPIGIQSVFLALAASLLWTQNVPFTLCWLTFGGIIGLPQVIPFVKYLPKTIRTKEVSSIGKIPPWHFLSLLFPKLFRKEINGVHYWEMAYYIGIAPLVIIGIASLSGLVPSRAWMIVVVSFFLMLGAFSKHMPRIPARFSFSFQFAMGWLAISSLTKFNFSTVSLSILILIQAFDLWWNNSDLTPTLPYSESPKKPSWAFDNRLTRYLEKNLGTDRVSGLPYPLFTGHINKLKTLGYCGGMQLKLMAKWRNDQNPDGGGDHDWFKRNVDNESLDRARTRFAYTRSKIDWGITPIKRLYRNPRLRHSGDGC